MWFLNWREEENLVMNIYTVECLCLWTIGPIVAPWKFDVFWNSKKETDEKPPNLKFWKSTKIPFYVGPEGVHTTNF